jgi:hypothetical protein
MSLNSAAVTDNKISIISLDRPFYDYLIISHQNRILQIWNLFIKFACLISSYLYLYMASFMSTHPEPGDTLYIFDIMFEAIFVIAMMQEFITDFEEIAQNKIVRDP